MRAPCHRSRIRGFIDPHAPDHSVRAAIKVCEHCPIRKECARDALTAGTSLDGEYTRPAGAVVQAGIICRGDQDTARALARVAGVPTPPHYRKQAPRPQLPDGCNHCGRPLHKWTRNPEEIPEGHVMHYAKRLVREMPGCLQAGP
ncbi:WhiB family transcriptional regulator [Corynebacterium suedekumii]|nr:WhiB family transcriptional regulator [Corynebacterium suedekumii]